MACLSIAHRINRKEQFNLGRLSHLVMNSQSDVGISKLQTKLVEVDADEPISYHRLSSQKTYNGLRLRRTQKAVGCEMIPEKSFSHFPKHNSVNFHSVLNAPVLVFCFISHVLWCNKVKAGTTVNLAHLLNPSSTSLMCELMSEKNVRRSMSTRRQDKATDKLRNNGGQWDLIT